MFGKKIWHTVIDLAIAGVNYILAAALVVFVWYEASPLIVWLLDLNLWFVKFGSSLLPEPYGSMAEVALRGALGADKALLFAEGALAAKGILGGVAWGYHRLRQSKKA